MPADMAWRPSGSLERLRLRARLLATIREFFDSRGALEVDTPALVNHGVTDVNLDSAEVRCGSRVGFLHTSPEYAMKRLLAAGSGDIYQLCHVVRGDESGRIMRQCDPSLFSQRGSERHSDQKVEQPVTR